jgi:O-methyltransferase involved in polyketide biosynthesis
MLPKSTRWVLRAIPARFFPRWMHANIELRTAYLNQAIAVELERSRSAGYANIRMIVLGGGYDARPVKLLAERQIDQAWEFDLPTVAKYKGKLIEKKSMLPKEDISKIDCIGIDLNDPEKLRSSLTTMIGNDVNAWHTIIISEALFLYLQPGVPEQLLDVCRDIFSEASLSFCFADKLANIAPDDRKAGEEWFAKIGWTLIDWIPKEGATRHMGVARPFR